MRWVMVTAVLAAGCDTEIRITPDNIDPSTTSSSSDTSAVSVGAGGAGGSTSSTGGTGGESSSSTGGAPPTEPPGFESGSRLRARIALGDDGSKVFLGMRDTELGLNCAWAKAADCALRCLPADAVVPSPARFEDGACTKPVVTVPKGAPKPLHAVLAEPEGASCPGGLRVFAIGDQVTGTYAPTGAVCPSGAGLPLGLDAYALGAEVPAATYLFGQEDVE